MVPIMHKLRKIGVAAAAANLSCEFRMPANKAVSDMKRTYGNVIRVNVTARSNVSLPTNPGASHVMTQGMTASPASTNRNRMRPRNVPASRAKRHAASRPAFCRVITYVGTNAAEKAPSAKRERNRFGRRSATKKASAMKPAPRKAATRTSRTNPKTRLTAVNPPMVTIDLIKAIGGESGNSVGRRLGAYSAALTAETTGFVETIPSSLDRISSNRCSMRSSLARCSTLSPKTSLT